MQTLKILFTGLLILGMACLTTVLAQTVITLEPMKIIGVGEYSPTIDTMLVTFTDIATGDTFMRYIHDGRLELVLPPLPAFQGILAETFRTNTRSGDMEMTYTLGLRSRETSAFVRITSVDKRYSAWRNFFLQEIM